MATINLRLQTKVKKFKRFPLEFTITQGDTLNIACSIDINLTNYKIRSSFFSDSGPYINNANDLSGGGDTQIELISASDIISYFTIKIAKNLTTNFSEFSYAYLEVEIEDALGEVTTILSARDTAITVNEQQINWTTP